MEDQLNPPSIVGPDQRLLAAERVGWDLALGGADHGHAAAVRPGQRAGRQYEIGQEQAIGHQIIFAMVVDSLATEGPVRAPGRMPIGDGRW
jgi:hypothetical protein